MAPQQSSVPPLLPPSVEEAYRRKCVQLKNRTNEVEDANDAARLRLARIRRQIEKLRIERAFLLEQLARRTSINVEDSEGSPSPPPTLAEFRTELEANPRKPKDKPLRIKRGHRKSATHETETKSRPAGSSKEPGSPLSESQAQPPERKSKSKSRKSASTSSNGLRKMTKGVAGAFEIYCNELRPEFDSQDKDGEASIEQELARGWVELSQDERGVYRAKYEEQARSRRAKEDKEDDKEKKRRTSEEGVGHEAHDEDVDMANYDTEDADVQAEKEDDE